MLGWVKPAIRDETTVAVVIVAAAAAAAIAVAVTLAVVVTGTQVESREAWAMSPQRSPCHQWQVGCR